MARTCGSALAGPRSDVPPPVAIPVADPRDLRDLLDVVEHVKQRVVERHVDQRIVARRQRLADLVHPVLERVVAPEVVRPEKSTFLQILAQPCRLVIVEVGAARLGHHDERASRQRVGVGEPHQRVVEVAVRCAADGRARQLGEAERQVLVRARPVHRPAGAVAVRGIAEHDAAEHERAVVARVREECRRNLVRRGARRNCAAATVARALTPTATSKRDGYTAVE